MMGSMRTLPPLPSWAPVLETPRLLLRLPVLADFDAYAAFAADPVASKHLGGVQSRAQAWRMLMATAGSWHMHGYSMFTVVDKATGTWAGRLGPWMPEGWPGTEVGWGIAPAFQGRGYAVEGARAAMDWATKELGWTDIIHTIAPDNTASIRVAEKLGAKLLRKGQLPAPYDSVDVDIYGY